MVSKRKLRRERAKQRTYSEKDFSEKVKTETAGSEKNKRIKNPFLRIYNNHYKILLIIPFIVLILSILQIGFQVAKTGEFVNRDVSLTGGLIITIPLESGANPNLNIEEINSLLKQAVPEGEIGTRTIEDFGTVVGLTIETTAISDDPAKNTEITNNILDALEKKVTFDRTKYSTETTGPSLGASFFKETIIAIIIAFVFMAIVVLLIFRTLIPSFAVVLAAFSDIITTLAIFNLLNLKLSTAGIAAFLMLIGYSVDTDILLSTRVLRKKDSPILERLVSAMKTGTTMNLTTLAAVGTALYFSESETIKQIMTILLIGLFVDMLNTWIQNAGILRMYVEKKERKNK